MSGKSIGSNAVSIAISLLPIYPAGAVEDFADSSDVWSGNAYETADAVMTPDGQFYKFGKNALVERTLTLAPLSPLRQFLDIALVAQVRQGPVVAEPFSATVIVTHQHNGQVDTYTDGILASGEVGVKVEQDRLGNAAYTFKFGKVIVKAGR